MSASPCKTRPSSMVSVTSKGIRGKEPPLCHLANW